MRYSARLRAQKSEHKSEAHRTVNRTFPVPQEDKASNRHLLPNPNGWVTWWRTGQCPVRPSTTAIPNGLLVVEGYKYPPTTTTPSIQVF